MLLVSEPLPIFTEQEMFETYIQPACESLKRRLVKGEELSEIDMKVLDSWRSDWRMFYGIEP